MQTYAGIDLDSSNNFVGVINDKDKILYGKRHANRLDDVLRALKPLFDCNNLMLMATNNWATIEFLKHIIKGIEKRVKS